MDFIDGSLKDPIEGNLYANKHALYPYPLPEKIKLIQKITNDFWKGYKGETLIIDHLFMERKIEIKTI